VTATKKDLTHKVTKQKERDWKAKTQRKNIDYIQKKTAVSKKQQNQKEERKEKEVRGI
jgi:hypothetical protein